MSMAATYTNTSYSKSMNTHTLHCPPPWENPSWIVFRSTPGESPPVLHPYFPTLLAPSWYVLFFSSSRPHSAPITLFFKFSVPLTCPLHFLFLAPLLYFFLSWFLCFAPVTGCLSLNVLNNNVTLWSCRCKVPFPMSITQLLFQEVSSQNHVCHQLVA